MMGGPASDSAAVSPPRVATWLLERCLPGPAGAALLGDLEEEFRTHAVPGWGIAKAQRWYWTQILRSLWPALTFHVHGRSAGRLVAAVLLGVVTLFVLGDLLMSAAVAGLDVVWPPAGAPGPLSEAAYLVGMLPASILGGYAAAWHGGRNGIAAGLVVAAITVLPLIATVLSASWTYVGWSHAAWFFVGPIGIVWGAMRYVRKHPVE